MSAAKPQSACRPKIIVLGAGRKPEVADETARIRPVIETLAEVVVWDLTFSAPLTDVDADFVLVFGGDGSVLRAVNQMGYRQRPLLSVNLGKLGFLTGLKLDE